MCDPCSRFLIARQKISYLSACGHWSDMPLMIMNRGERGKKERRKEQRNASNPSKIPLRCPELLLLCCSTDRVGHLSVSSNTETGHNSHSNYTAQLEIVSLSLYSCIGCVSGVAPVAYILPYCKRYWVILKDELK